MHWLCLIELPVPESKHKVLGNEEQGRKAATLTREGDLLWGRRCWHPQPGWVPPTHVQLQRIYCVCRHLSPRPDRGPTLDPVTRLDLVGGWQPKGRSFNSVQRRNRLVTKRVSSTLVPEAGAATGDPGWGCLVTGPAVLFIWVADDGNGKWAFDRKRGTGRQRGSGGDRTWEAAAARCVTWGTAGLGRPGPFSVR